MQYVPGQSLDRLIAHGPASLQLVLSVGIQIADGFPAGSAYAGNLPSGLETAERDADGRRPGEDSGLWIGAAAATGGCKL